MPVTIDASDGAPAQKRPAASAAQDPQAARRGRRRGESGRRDEPGAAGRRRERPGPHDGHAAWRRSRRGSGTLHFVSGGAAVGSLVAGFAALGRELRRTAPGRPPAPRDRIRARGHERRGALVGAQDQRLGVGLAAQPDPGPSPQRPGAPAGRRPRGHARAAPDPGRGGGRAGSARRRPAGFVRGLRARSAGRSRARSAMRSMRSSAPRRCRATWSRRRPTSNAPARCSAAMIQADALRPPSALDLAASAYKDWLHLNVLDHASGRSAW